MIKYGINLKVASEFEKYAKYFTIEVKMKKIIICLIVFMIAGCQETSTQVDKKIEVIVPKNTSESMLISDSVILPSNLDQYLFLEDVYYVDTREPNQFLEEGHVAGFINIPYYEVIASLNNEDTLFKMKKVFDENNKLIIGLGENGSYEPIYEESISILKSLFPQKKKIFIISTAGVESTYLANLLIQYGYDASLIYNVGNFSNTVGSIASYRELTDVKYKVEGLNSYKLEYRFDFGELKKINEAN